MFEAVLFLGLQVTPEIEKCLAQANPHAVKLFVDNNSNYLHHADHDGQRYLGKQLETVATFASLELVEHNVLSLLRKLLGENWTVNQPMLLFATKRPTHG